jgi:ferritin-like metal-binding protein YciE
MAVDSLRMHLIEELADLLDAEGQLTKALPKMSAAATTPTLKTAFKTHLKETRAQIVRLNKAMRQLGEKPRRKTCEGMQGLLNEGEEVMKMTPAGALRDAVMITAAQKVEHYEMASYGTARTYAQVLGELSVARLLAHTLKEEKAADGKLTLIAERSVNEDAADEWRAQEDEPGIVGRSTARGARRRVLTACRWCPPSGRIRGPRPGSLTASCAAGHGQAKGRAHAPNDPSSLIHLGPSRRMQTIRGREQAFRPLSLCGCREHLRLSP